MADFLSCRAKEGTFNPTAPCWLQGAYPVRFWQLQAMFSKGLSTLTVRLLSTPVNTVPSERVCSAQNLIHDKKRKRLASEKANKLVYIHMNPRILDLLDRPQPTKRSLHNADKLRLKSDILDAIDDNVLKDNDNADNDVQLQKRRPSSQLPHRPMPPSLGTELTDDLKSLL